MLANIDKQIASARMELESLRKGADARLAHQRRMEHIARQQAEAEQMKHHRMMQMRNRVNLTRYAEAMRRPSLPTNQSPGGGSSSADIAVKKQAFLKHALHQIEVEISKLRAAQKHALDLENSLRQHRSKIMEQQMTLQERRCDFLEALKSLSGSAAVPLSSAEMKAAKSIASSSSSSSSSSPKREIQTVDLTSKDDDEQNDSSVSQQQKERQGSPTPSHNTMTPPLTPELSMESERAADALAMLGDLAARLSSHESSKFFPQESPKQTRV